MVLIEAKDIAIGDYDQVHGTVVDIDVQEKIIKITFKNGDVIYPQKDLEMEILQGGRFDRNHPKAPPGTI